MTHKFYLVSMYRKRALLCYFITIVISTQAVGQQYSPVMNAFKQGITDGGGNCASIAFIKMAIATYGVGNVFQKRTDRELRTTDFVLKNGNTVTLNDTEISEAITKASFIQNHTDAFSIKIKQYADTCFAIMCKKLQLITSVSFDSAILDLNSGHNLTINTPQMQDFLGLQVTRIEPHRAAKIKRLNNIVVYNYHHAAYAGNGFYDEAWNESGVNPLEKFKWKRWSIMCSYKMCGLSGAFQIVE